MHKIMSAAKIVISVYSHLILLYNYIILLQLDEQFFHLFQFQFLLATHKTSVPQ